MGSSLFAEQISLLDKHTDLHCSTLLHCCRMRGPFGNANRLCVVVFSTYQLSRKGTRILLIATCDTFLQHSSVDGFVEPPVPPTKSASRHSLPRCRNSFTSTEECPHIGNYRLLKTIGKGNFAKVKLAQHVLTGREVRDFICFINLLGKVLMLHPCIHQVPSQCSSMAAQFTSVQNETVRYGASIWLVYRLRGVHVAT